MMTIKTLAIMAALAVAPVAMAAPGNLFEQGKAGCSKECAHNCSKDKHSCPHAKKAEDAKGKACGCGCAAEKDSKGNKGEKHDHSGHAAH